MTVFSSVFLKSSLGIALALRDAGEQGEKKTAPVVYFSVCEQGTSYIDLRWDPDFRGRKHFQADFAYEVAEFGLGPFSP